MSALPLPHFPKMDVERELWRDAERRVKAALRAAIREAYKDVTE